MTVFYLTFGQKYRTEPHPVLGDRPELADGWLTVTADSMDDAREKVFSMIGTAWCWVYEPDDMRTELYDAGNLGPLEVAIAERCECFEVDPKRWTTYGSSVEPGSTHEWNPDCPVHRPMPDPNIPF